MKDLLANKKTQQMIPASYPFQSSDTSAASKIIKKEAGGAGGGNMLNMGGHEGASNTEVLP